MKIAFVYDAIYLVKEGLKVDLRNCRRLADKNKRASILFPDEVVRGHSGRFVAHKLLNDYLVRVVYEYENEFPVVITLYIAKKERYFRGGIYEDKILSRFGYT